MIIWIDADSCPKPVRELVCRTGTRLGIQIQFVANHLIPIPAHPLFIMSIADSTPDAADDYIVEHCEVLDLVITRDIPLAKRLVDKNIPVINDRGTVYTEKNINERLSIRNLMFDLYSNGIYPEKTGQFGKKEMQEFANALDREVHKLLKLKSTM